MDNWWKRDCLTIRGISVIWVSVSIVSHGVRLRSPASIRIEDMGAGSTQGYNNKCMAFGTKHPLLSLLSSKVVHHLLATHLNLGSECPLSLNVALSLSYYTTKSLPSFTVREKECSIVWKRKVYVLRNWGNFMSYQLCPCPEDNRSPVGLSGTPERIHLTCFKSLSSSLISVLSHDNGENMSRWTTQWLALLFYEKKKHTKNVYTRNREACLAKITHEITQQNISLYLAARPEQSHTSKWASVVWLQTLFSNYTLTPFWYLKPVLM